jgi:heptaprenyl diphosphate synthase
MKTNKLTRGALLASLMLALGYVESLLPAFSSIPGIKLGLANTVLLYAVYLCGVKTSIALAAIKVLLSGFLFGSPAAMLYSASGAAVSLAIMLLIKRTGKFSTVGVSVAGAIGHNIGQCIAAAAVIGLSPVLAYFPMLLLSGAVTGLVTGTAAALVIKHMHAGVNKKEV